ncbi:2-amino-4-hydroxy-6-hydroxymethyldihydropteridine diphosphokinase [Treponema zioleckii]|uniref:2-amino-4-hydroxy-6- hydroxymethyldihydropteridine diphosphokinase n=1 Tax=Treponema zioleckii TaxID=331680 RepID=UPI0024139313|nr:2-amino-4-hydroxy-6-hydroxymethyldihydropteridine diphosphokinase [Treponema zioleckii]
MEFVVLGLGSNKSWNGMKSLEILEKACCLLREFIHDFKASSVFRTKPMYVKNQDDFYNMVACGFVKDIEPFDLLEKIHKIEYSLGRNREKEIRNGPRSIDIDIEIFGKTQIHSDVLEIPHPRLCEREFVLVPLMDVFSKNPNFVSADIFDIKKYQKMLEELQNSSGDGIIERLVDYGNE